jgi:RNA polymerase sigma-70 factor (ECF subfamily)
VIVTTMLDERGWLDAERRRLVGLCACITGDYAVAEDLAQETLLEAWRHRDRLHEPSGADRWLSAIARNVCLRWSRRRGRDSVLIGFPDVEPADLSEEDVGGDELDQRLEAALARLPDATRDMVVGHHVHGMPHAELSVRHGISEEAVSMRISRARVLLRTVLDPQPGDGWRGTRLWCPSCGSHRLQIRRDEGHVRFRCTGCSPASASYDLGNPFFARLLGDLVRPTAILNRAAAWSSEYFRRGVGRGSCTRCRAPIDVRRHRDGRRNGLLGVCGACGEQVWSSVVGLAHAHREARVFHAEHGRVRTLPERDLSYCSTPATVVRLEAVRGCAALDIVLARDTLRVLATH